MAVWTLIITIGFAVSGCGGSAPYSSPAPAQPSAAAGTPALPGPETPSPQKPASPSKLLKVEFRSEALGTTKRMRVYLPPGYDGESHYPVLYMLHGYGAAENAWMPDMQLDKAADRLIAAGVIEPLIIVAPEMDNSYGLNSAEKYRVADPKHPASSRFYGRYEDYFVHDVVTYVDTHYRTAATREGRYVGGYSMGGFIALYAAFRHPDLFSKAGGHSPALWLDDWSRVPLMKSWLYPTPAVRKARDPVELARTADLEGLSVYLDCGDQDDFKLYEGAGKLYGILQERGIPSEYHLNSGKHNRTYWTSHIDDYLRFYAPKTVSTGT